MKIIKTIQKAFEWLIDIVENDDVIYKYRIYKYLASQKEREKNFPYYCKTCDYGCLDGKLMVNHNLTKKHINNVHN